MVEKLRVNMKPHILSDRVRDPHDFYATPEAATRALLPLLPKSVVTVWDPAAGQGHITRVAKKAGYKVVASDLYAGTPSIIGAKRDFLKIKSAPASWGTTALVTNPPFKKFSEFLAHALSLNVRVVAFHCAMQHLGGVERYERFYKNTPPALLVLFARTFTVEGLNGVRIKSSFHHNWLVWDMHATSDSTKAIWIENDRGS